MYKNTLKVDFIDNLYIDRLVKYNLIKLLGIQLSV